MNRQLLAFGAHATARKLPWPPQCSLLGVCMYVVRVEAGKKRTAASPALLCPHSNTVGCQTHDPSAAAHWYSYCEPPRACRRYFYASIQLGSPPKLFAVIADTGSTITYVPCTSCGAACGTHHRGEHGRLSLSYAAIRQAHVCRSAFSCDHNRDHGDEQAGLYTGSCCNQLVALRFVTWLQSFAGVAFDPEGSGSVTDVGCASEQCVCGRPACGCSSQQQCTYSRTYGALR